MPKIYSNEKFDNENVTLADKGVADASSRKAVRKLIDKVPVHKDENATEDER